LVPPPTVSNSKARVHLPFFFFSSRRRHTRFSRDWSSDVCSSDLHLAARLADGLEHARKELLAVLQQLEMVARHPARGAARPLGAGGAAHSAISAASGAWSDSRFQGWRGSGSGRCTEAPRT